MRVKFYETVFRKDRGRFLLYGSYKEFDLLTYFIHKDFFLLLS